MTGRPRQPDRQIQPAQQHACPQTGACVAAAAMSVRYHFLPLHLLTLLRCRRIGYLLLSIHGPLLHYTTNYTIACYQMTPLAAVYEACNRQCTACLEQQSMTEHDCVQQG